MKRLARLSRFSQPQDGLRAVAERAPQAEAMVASWIEVVRPYAMRIYMLRRRVATLAVIVLAGALFVHVMFGANGMVVYKQKRAEYQELRKQIVQQQAENDRYTQQIQGLKSDQSAIEKEAREQFGYVRKGEVVYVPGAPVKTTPPSNHTAKK
ncbi:MAG TPA: septum formation initiator family protein [Candidatus Sulfotelmatobacter sp.]|nr:septum formation initiator family protein [Candidatus Sulfotelmatobacter sp.]